jgi:two-component sensor histidine kinase
MSFNMSLNQKFLSYTVISLSILLIILGFVSYYEVRKNTEEEAFRIGERLVAEVEATRSYVREVLRPKTIKLIKTGEFIPEMMSASFVARNIFERFLKQYPDYHIKFASLNPRNPINKADMIEKSIISHFQSEVESVHKWEGIVNRNGQDYFTVAKSFPLKKACLRCHGDPIDAPKSLLIKYGSTNGFGMNVGDITMYSAGVPVTVTFADIWQQTFSKFWPIMLLVILFLITISKIFKNLVSEPIDLLSNTIRSFSKGDYSARVDLAKVGKLKNLADSFNEMARQLSENISYRKKTEEQLLVQQTHLEDRVQERTKELQKKISNLEEAELEISSNLKEKEILLQEIHHRVKNNMTVVASLLKLQMNNTANKETQIALQDSLNRIQAITLIHESLYRSDNLTTISVQTYLNQLSHAVHHGYDINKKASLKLNIQNFSIGIKQASPLGLIVNELITNSLKYAFPDNKEGEITLNLTLNQENKAELTISDNGVGIQEGFVLNDADSLGLKLVKAIAENQLDGSINMETKNGTKFTIKFNIET